MAKGVSASRARRVAVWGCSLVLVMSLGTTGLRLRAQGCDIPPEDYSYVNFYGSCGTQNVELVSIYGPNEYDEGGETIFGTCAGNYYKCDCSWVGPYDAYGSWDYNEDAIYWGEYDVSWNLNNLANPTYSACQPAACGGDGEVEFIGTNTLFNIAEHVETCFS